MARMTAAGIAKVSSYIEREWERLKDKPISKQAEIISRNSGVQVSRAQLPSILEGLGRYHGQQNSNLKKFWAATRVLFKDYAKLCEEFEREVPEEIAAMIED